MNLLAEFGWVEAGVCLAVGVICGIVGRLWRENTLRKAGELRREAILENARREAESIAREARLEAGEEVSRARLETEKTRAEMKREHESAQQRLGERETLVNRQLEAIVEREHNLRDRQLELQAQKTELRAIQTEAEALVVERRAELEKVARLSESGARAELIGEVKRESLKDANDVSRRILAEAKSQAEDRARRIVGLAIQRYAGEHTFETTTATVGLNGDDIKGRIIGREGRNIRAFEAATGITVLIDDTPNAVVLSGFDPVRREVARQAMERLIQDGRIHPTRIEEVVERVKTEIDQTIMEVGEDAVSRLGLPPLHTEIVKLLGRLRFRYSFSQNILDHSIEVAQLTGIMASELGVDVQSAKRTGLLHDIGKAVNHEVEGSHAAVGAELVKRFGESEEVANGVAAHHGEVQNGGLLAVLVSAADAASASRPGARSESMATYLKRLESLEKIGAAFEGVEKCYAVQAGRELRVLVRPESLDDDEAYSLAKQLARKIEEVLLYPGQIRVTVVRETRCVEFAK